MTTTTVLARHTWAEHGTNEKRCTGCSTTAVRTWRAGGVYDVAFFAADGRQITEPATCGGTAPAVERSGRPGLFYVYLAPGAPAGQEPAVERELAGIARREQLPGWTVHRDPPFVSLRLTADGMTSAEDAARPLVSEAFQRAGLSEPALREVIAIPAGQGAPACATPPAAGRTQTPQAFQPCLEAG